jgi:transaldolase
VTLIFNSAQATLAAKAGATYVSPFVGRLDDNSISGLDAVKYIAELYQKQNVATKVLSASIRDVDSVTSSFYNGAHIVTMPPSIFWKMYNHVLTDRGMDMFQRDWDLALQSFQHLTN